MDWQAKFETALPYADFLDRYAKPQDRQRWQGMYEQATLTDEQRSLLSGFVRTMNVLCLAGAWCGDCVNQCPILQRFAEANDRIRLRFLDRDEQGEVQQALSLCGGRRVPVVLFCSEDFAECGRYGDRTLSKYRELGQTLGGAACPTGLGGQDKSLLEAVTGEWLNEFERVQWMLRLSPSLRQKHGD